MARLRLDSYPWLQYGTVAAVVTTVPRTPREGWLEVRLSIAQEPPAPIALDFGMTGVVEVAVEQVSPAELLLRTAGRRISR
jgi:membrane fusion protein (multidrug efflux system)